MDSSKKLNESTTVTVLQRKKYGCFCKVFCCKCVYCCQSLDFSLLTSQNRKGVFFNMINQYIKSIESEPNVIIDPFFILLGLLMGQQDQKINTATLLQIQDGNQKHAMFSKQDLQMYLPQLCTYLVFHQEMANIPIFNLLQRTARFDLQFALLYFSYMKSLQIINENTEFKVVMKYNKTFKRKIDQHFKFLIDPTGSHVCNSEKDQQVISAYNQRENNLQLKQWKNQKLHHNPARRLYQPCLCHDKFSDEEYGIFSSSLNFFNDLIQLGYNLTKTTQRKAMLIQKLHEINKKLPADVYLPFKKQDVQGMKVCNIVFEQSRVFSTKMRAPYYICLQVYQERLNNGQNSKLSRRIVSNTNINEHHLKKSHLFQIDTIEQQLVQDKKNEQQSNISAWISKVYKLANGAKKFYKNKLQQQGQTTCEIKIQSEEEDTQTLFGESQIQLQKRIKQVSPFSELPNHKFVHFIVKTEDDLRQQAFAMQLLQQFNQIFKMQGLSIHLVPYEVIPLGHNCGLIQLLKDALTIDEIRKKQHSLGFIKKDPIKLKNFMDTLIGYSLVTYFMQVKDRHNGNIMVRRDGSIIHIDFGFFMSNAPGKGVELEKKVAFKMTNEYIDILGGLESKEFQQFRKLFFRGYQACRKHQHRILILTKLMYSSHGTTMPCFIKGNAAINCLEDRLNPPGIHTDGDLSLHCQNLVNSSIDNWRARWYDKWQYYMQGILY